MASHRIHLRGPWDFTWQPEASQPDDSVPMQGAVTMPQEWRSIFGNTKGTAQFRRKFHRPTNLDPHEQVMIVFTEVRGRGQVLLNDVALGEFESDGQPVEFEITKLMKSFSELVVIISYNPHEANDLPGGLFGVAALEIRSE